jgi:hypothetical protein
MSEESTITSLTTAGGPTETRNEHKQNTQQKRYHCLRILLFSGNCMKVVNDL